MKVDIARKNIHETWRAGWGGSSVLGERSAVTKEVLGSICLCLETELDLREISFGDCILC